MRRFGRVLLLLAIPALLAVVGYVFYEQKRAQELAKQPPPKSLPKDTNASASDWSWSQNDGDRPVIEVRAKNFKQITDPPRFELEGVELHLFHKDGKIYDLVKSSKADFRMMEGTLYSEGDVEIIMGVPAETEGQPSGRLVHVKSSGVTFESKTGRAFTDRRAEFGFENGNGKATGATYDPGTRELHLHKDVALDWHKSAKPMHVEAGEVFYKERDSLVMLGPWSKFHRDGLDLEAADSLVFLEKGEIRRVESKGAKGVDKLPKRQIDYAADNLTMYFGDGGAAEKITGESNARLVALNAASKTSMSTDRLDLEFAKQGKDSVLTTAWARGKAHVESEPVPAKGPTVPETRKMTSDVIEVKMRPGGEEIEAMNTHSPGFIEFLPNREPQRYRRMDGERISINYGPQNRIEAFHAVEVATITKRPPKKTEPNPPDAMTWSKLLEARFDAKGQMTQMDQTGDFRYKEGERQARAERASLEQATNRITLTGGARAWDPTGSTNAAQIVMDQTSGDMVAEGEVASTRLPDKKPQAANKQGSMLDPGEALQGRADKMTIRDRNRQIRYEGNAKLWQASNRIEAPTIDINRTEQQQRLEARGGVLSQFVDKPDEKKKKANPQTVFTIIRAPELTYTDADKLAHYKGGVQLNRPGMVVTSKELRAYLSNTEGNSSLDRAIADGDVVIEQVAVDRKRKGTSDHGEYELKEGKVTLTGGTPALEDSKRGTTRGQKLVWFADNDRLLVDGAPGQPAVSRINRNK